MAQRKIVAVSMIGMNRGSQGDSDHPFDMKQYTDKYAVHWLSQVSEKEEKGSTLFYECMKAVDNLCQKSSIPPENVQFICGRGTLFRGSERELMDALEKYSKPSGNDTFKVFIAKSFGVVDTLRAFKYYGNNVEEKIGRINCMFLIDGYGPYFSRRSVSKKFKSGGKKESRFRIPPYVDKVYTLVQRYQGSKGLKAGSDGDPRITNINITQHYVDSFNLIYDSYSDGFKRKLDVTHFNMDEIAAIIPWCKESKDSFIRMDETIEKEYRKIV